MTNPKWVMKENITKAVNSQSMPAMKPPTTAAGSCGRGCTGGGTTNWKSSVVSPMTTLPREVSFSLTW